MCEPRGIMRLSNELLKEILDYLVEDPEKYLSIDSRAYLSMESFKFPSLPAVSGLPGNSHMHEGFRDDLRTDIDCFREVCKRFAEVGEAHKFNKIVVRFSEHGFERLNLLSSNKRLARNARKFTYIIRSFYTEGWFDPKANFMG